MSDNQATTTHPWEQAITELQENFDRQTVTNHQLIQKLINSVSRLETMVTTNMNAVVQPQVQGILGPSPDTHLQPSMQTENGQGTQRSVQTENGQGTQRFHIKLELPRFDGSDPHGWVFRIQEYFDFYDTPDTQRLRIAGFTMEGKASEWYQWMKKNRLLTTWMEFLQNVTKRFGESRFEDFQGKLSKLTQQTTVTAYQAEFERLMNKVTGIAEPILLSMFIAGLKPLIRREVQMARPTTLMEAFDLAREYEAKLEEIQAELQPVARSPLRWQQRQIPPANTTRSAPVITQSSVQDKRETTTLALPPSTQSTSNLPIKRLTPAEMREKREKGICYNCDQRWSNNHRCRTRFLMLMGTGDDDIEDPLLQEDTIVHGQDDIISGDISSLNSLAGPGNPRSLKLLGEVNGQKLQILIDSGSTHNFVQPKIAEQLQLHALKVTPFRVYVGNGDSLACSHSCKQVPLTLHGTEFLIDFFVLPIRGPDMVLGIQWLRGLGKVEHDYANMSMQFEWKGQQVKLQGNHSLTPQEITLNQLEAPVATREILELYELFLISGPESPPEENNTEKSIQVIQLPTDIPPEIITVLQQHEKLFQAPATLPPYRFFNHRIHLQPGTKPINVRPYRYPHFQKEEIEKLVTEMLDQGIIRPSQSPFSSPVLLVKKKDGTYRFCVDYRALNAATVRDQFPIPTADELFDELGQARVFTKLDLRAGYHQIRMHDRDIYKTAFRTHEGHYEFLVMPFGLMNAPSTFQATMNRMLHQFLRKFVIVFFDDILVYSQTLEDHIYHLQEVFGTLQQYEFYLKLSKCRFCQTSIEYLGHIIDQEGVHADPNKIEVMINWPQPKTIRQLRGFLGMTGYYRRFIKGYANIAAPLTDLLKKDAFQWGQKAEEAFTTLKTAMTKTPILRLPDFSKHFIVETDASNEGIGAILVQEDRPIAFFSKKLGSRLKNSSTYNRELFAIVEAVQKWRQYLLGRFFIIRTDHKSLKELLQQVVQTPTQQHYVRKLMGYNFKIEYKPGNNNKVADALSRREKETAPNSSYGEVFLTVSKPIPELIETIRKENNSEPDILQLHQKNIEGRLPNYYAIKDGMAFYKGRYCIGANSKLKSHLLQEFHSTPMAGHTGVTRTLVRLAANFHWINMRDDVKKFIATCQICQQTKYSTQPPAGLLQPLPVPSRVWEDVTMDFITGLPVSRGQGTIMVVVDRLTKYVHFGTLPHQFSAQKAANVFVEIVAKHHGFPATIVSDRDPIFLSKFWDELFTLSGTTLKRSTAYHPQTDGQTEVMNRGLEQYLRAFTHAKPTNWTSYLGWAEFCANTSYHSSIKMTPFQALYGRPPPTLSPYNQDTTTVQALDELLLDRDRLIRQLKLNLLEAQHRMAQKANAKRSEVEFSVGDKVWLRLQPYRQISVARRSSNKLARRYYGPFKILEKIGEVAYRLELPPQAKIHSVFHVSQLKKHMGTEGNIEVQFPEKFVGQSPISTPLALCGERDVLKNGKIQHQVLVQWSDSNPENATWETADEMERWYPNLHLEDKVVAEGKGSDTGISTVEEGENQDMKDREETTHTARPKRERRKPAWMADYIC